jgi:hypothetical protein
LTAGFALFQFRRSGRLSILLAGSAAALRAGRLLRIPQPLIGKFAKANPAL